MHNTLHKSEILRGYSAFSDVLKNGEMIQSQELRCYFRTAEKKKGPPVRVGFAVPRKVVPLAVDRNRIKRYMREAFRKNKIELHTTADKRDLQIVLVLVFKKSSSQANVRMVRYASIERDLVDIVAKISSHA
ncbi:MAG TPA: ribonuclease P protein component [Bacteroidota bacterium]|nr:ribonuclease P protein component [Bacteroidota bacterium]